MYVKRKRRLKITDIIGVPISFICNVLTWVYQNIVWLFFPNKVFSVRIVKYVRVPDDWYSKNRNREIINKCDYVLDEGERRLLQLSPKLSLLTGHSAEFLRQNFIPYAPTVIMESDAEIYSNIFIPQVIDVFSSIPPKQRAEYSLRCNFRVKHKDNSARNIFQKTVFSETSSNGQLLVSASLIEDITGIAQEGVMNGWLDRYTPDTHSSLHLGTFNTNLPNSLFTSREIQILELMADGLPIKQIADKLYISIKTVDRHKENIKNKTGAKNSTELIKIALKSGLIK